MSENGVRIERADPLGERAEDTLDDNGRLPYYSYLALDNQGRETATGRQLRLMEVTEKAARYAGELAFESLSD